MWRDSDKEPLKKLPKYALGLVKYSCSDNRLYGHCINPFPAELVLNEATEDPC